jgi:hypothetical protein
MMMMMMMMMMHRVVGRRALTQKVGLGGRCHTVQQHSP